MNTIHKRIKTLRKELKMNQTEFGKCIGIRKSGLSLIENGTNNVTEQMFLLICREFNVNEEWLRTGEGEMFVQLTREEEIASFIGSVLSGHGEHDDFKKALLKVLSKTTESEWEMLEKKANELFQEMHKQDTDTCKDDTNQV